MKPRKNVHPMHRDANLPARMTKRARKLLRKRRRELAEELPDTIDDAAPDGKCVPLPGWARASCAGEHIENHNGTLLRRYTGQRRSLALDLAEHATEPWQELDDLAPL